MLNVNRKSKAVYDLPSSSVAPITEKDRNGRHIVLSTSERCHLLWPPYAADTDIIFCSCGF